MKMTIREILVKDRGPIDQFMLKPGRLTLIYGKNEHGKTHLVEFLIQCLFRKNKEWSIRPGTGRGHVMVDGLGDRSETFAPASRKLEDFWEEQNPDLSGDFSRLLVVKGAEVELAKVSGGIDKAVVKQYLSNQTLLDKIEAGIPATILKAEVLGDGIAGSKGRGPIQDRENLLARLNEIDGLFGRIEKTYSGSRRQQLAAEKNEHQKALDLMKQARSHMAWQLAEKEKCLQEELVRYDSKNYKDLQVEIKTYERLFAEIDSKRAEKEKNESTHYDWLKQAADLYKTRFLQVPGKTLSRILPFLFMLFLAFSAVSMLWLRNTVFAVTGIALAAAVILFSTIKNYYQSGHPSLRKEYERLAKEYRKRFDEPLSGIAQLEARLESLEAMHRTAQILDEQIRKKEMEFDEQECLIGQYFQALTGKSVPRNRWNQEINACSADLHQLQQTLTDTRVELGRLNVDKSGYREDPVSVTYSRQEEDQCIQALKKIEEQVREEENKLKELEKDLFNLLKKAPAGNWLELFAKLQEERESVRMQYQELTADILGKKMVQKVISEMRLDEDEHIRTGLKSPEMVQALMDMTGKYQSVRLEADQLMVSDGEEEFALSDLSTGSQEQVLLALRIGFSRRLLKREAAFLILDDAFQHSDWERRIRLVDMMVSLVKSGWQVLYFTMDDHIRDLFEKKGRALGNDFIYKTLE
jgi:uncharacterized protein YhaN